MNGQTGSILVGYDGSMSSRTALDWAAETARRQGKGLTLLHCVSLSSVPGYPAYDPGMLVPRMEESSTSVITDGIEQVRQKVFVERINRINAIGSPAAELVDSSKDADLVVVGCRGRGRLRGSMLGSTAFAVASHAHCPVVIVRGPRTEQAESDTVHPAPVHPGPDRRVVVGIDDSEESHRALDEAASVAAAARAPLHVVRVALAPMMDEWAYANVAPSAEPHQTLQEYAEESVTNAITHVRATHPDLAVDGEVLHGEAGHCLATLSAGAGMVVVGSRGRGGFSGLLLGSVSHTVIHEAVCPVMVVH